MPSVGIISGRARDRARDRLGRELRRVWPAGQIHGSVARRRCGSSPRQGRGMPPRPLHVQHRGAVLLIAQDLGLGARCPSMCCRASGTSRSALTFGSGTQAWAGRPAWRCRAASTIQSCAMRPAGGRSGGSRPVRGKKEPCAGRRRHRCPSAGGKAAGGFEKIAGALILGGSFVHECVASLRRRRLGEQRDLRRLGAGPIERRRSRPGAAG